MTINFSNARLVNLSIYSVGNKEKGEPLFAPEISNVNLTDELKDVVTNYFLSGFKELETYNFWHESQIELNNVYNFSNSIFSDINSFDLKSKNIAQHLYEKSTHPKIQGGELYVSYFSQCIIDNDVVDAICIVKSESKDSFIKTNFTSNKVEIELDSGLNINNINKGCLIFNIEKENGYKVVVIDNASRGQDAAVYWKDDFLQLKIRNDSYNQTSNALGIYKNFVTNKIDEEFDMTKTDKIDLLNRSMKYFKEKETFDMDEFADEVIANPKAIESFKTFKSQYEDEFDTRIGDTFEISNNAVKKQARVYKSVLKLDKNFHIYIHGDNKLIEKGFDDEKAMNYYKVFFKEEQ
ncbi:MAG: hypothetical protein JWR50_4189 [Mucilaginibacter sp.]|nr:hypothetical protein [Mucilaginibacter sp.]